jgi:predicted metal-dependent hydrolase
MFRGLLRRKRVGANKAARALYLKHKEEARRVIMARLSHYAALYGYTWNRVAIRDQQRRWGSCSSKKNLNFNYKLIFLPKHLLDYVVIHELCHLVEMNHGKDFWDKVSVCCPNYQSCIAELRALERLTKLDPDRMKNISLGSTFHSSFSITVNV